MQLISGVLATFVVCASLAQGLCHNSISCLIGGDNVCNNVCVRQGNPSGGRCMPRDGCPGYDICACYPRKRADEIVDGDVMLTEVMKEMGLDDELEKLGAREVTEETALEKRSICCSLVPPFSGLCCENHCSYIGKPGGQCSDKSICTCN